MKVWMTRRRGILGRKPTLFPSPRTRSAHTEHSRSGRQFYSHYSPKAFPFWLLNGTGHRLEFLLLLAAGSLLVGFAPKLPSEGFPGQLFPGFLLRMLQAEGEKRAVHGSKGAHSKNGTLSSRSPCGRVGTGDLEADLLNGSAHYFIVGLNRRMDHQLNLHSSKH